MFSPFFLPFLSPRCFSPLCLPVVSPRGGDQSCPFFCSLLRSGNLPLCLAPENGPHQVPRKRVFSWVSQRKLDTWWGPFSGANPSGKLALRWFPPIFFPPSMWAFPAWFWRMSGSCAIYVPKRQLDVEKKKWGETSAEDCKKYVIFWDIRWLNWPVLKGVEPSIPIFFGHRWRNSRFWAIYFEIRVNWMVCHHWFPLKPSTLVVSPFLDETWRDHIPYASTPKYIPVSPSICLGYTLWYRSIHQWNTLWQPFTSH